MGGLVLFALLLVSGCSTQEETTQQVLSENGAYIMESIEISTPEEDLYQKSAAYNERVAAQDKWDEFAETLRHELEIDADLSDDWIDCERDMFVDVSVENSGDVAEDEAFVLLDGDKLGVHSKKMLNELGPGHRTVVRFPLDLENAAAGTYEFIARVFREEEEFEGADSAKLRVGNC